MSAKKQAPIGVLQFPGSNCDEDCLFALDHGFGIKAKKLWFQDLDLSEVVGVVLPGGFSFGDYWRAGFIAAHSQSMNELLGFVKRGGSVLGICNGFQVLTELKLLPGALLVNQSNQFICRSVGIKKAVGSSLYHRQDKEFLNLPIAHKEGRYLLSGSQLQEVLENEQVLYQYNSDVNGSTDSIAGIMSSDGRVVGMMPHPERAVSKELFGSDDGLQVFEAFLASCL